VNQIDAGLILPGEQVSEKALMAQIGVSRTPVREALIRLEAEGLIQRHARKGAVLFKPDVAEFLTILEVHSSLESHAAELAAQRITPDMANCLRDIVAACKDHVEKSGVADYAEYYTLNIRFHGTIARASGNAVLADLIRLNARKLMGYYRMRYRAPGNSAKSCSEHSVICDHIVSNRPQEARLAMLEHFNYDRFTITDLIAALGQE
jgi:DNA-binding GntR family transcriptional regulator